MEKFFFPESLAVVGVSQSLTNLARRILFNCRELGYKGRTWGVGKSVEEIEGYPVLASVADLPEPVDLAAILIPAPKIPEVLRQCGKRGIKRVIVESGGFAEFEGRESRTQKETLEVLREYGMRMLGPNCIGVVNRLNGLATPFARFLRRPRQGGVSCLVQSGGVGLGLLAEMNRRNVGMSKFCSFGNALDVNEVDLVDYFASDGDTQIIMAYLEGFVDGRKLVETVSRIDKPVVALKSNIHEVSRGVAGSHSAAMAADDRLVDCAFRQAGIMRVKNLSELMGSLETMTLPRMRGNRLAVLSRSGGHAVLTADAAGTHGFVLPEFPPTFFANMGKYFENSVIRLQNPLDFGQIFYEPVIGSILEEILKLDEIDGVVLLHLYDSRLGVENVRQFLSRVKPLMEQYGKPVTVILHTDAEERKWVGENFGIPVFTGPSEGVAALAAARDAWKLCEQRRPQPKEIVPGAVPAALAVKMAALTSPGTEPVLPDFLEILDILGLRVAPYRVVSDEAAAVAAATDLGGETVMKIVHPRIAHKWDFDGVKTGLVGPAAVAEAWRGMRDMARAKGFTHAGGRVDVMLQKTAETGVEMIVGGRRDQVFGPVVLLGTGGVYTELFEDVTMRLAPIDLTEAAAMPDEIRGAKLLNGFRRHPPADKPALADAVVRVSDLLAAFPALTEIDLNPVIVHPEGRGVTIVDAHMVLRRE